MYILTVKQENDNTIKEMFETFEKLQEFAKDYPNGQKYVVEDRGGIPREYETLTGERPELVYPTAQFRGLDEILNADPDDPFVTKA